MSERKPLSVLIDRFLPVYIRSTYPKFEKLIQYYLEYLEQDGKVLYLINDFLHYLDIDKIEENDPYSAGDSSILELHIKQYLSNFPLYRIEDIDIKKLIKNAKDFYSIKGTEKSYDFIFRLMNHLGTFSFYYPGEDLLIASNATEGLLSSNKIIHDNKYWAYFTYEIRSNLFGYVELKDIIENLIHPVGLKTFFLRYVYGEATLETENQNGCMNIFHNPSTITQWSEYWTYSIIYNYGNWDFNDLDSGVAGIINQMTFYDWGDSFYSFENATSNPNYFPYQLSAYLTTIY